MNSNEKDICCVALIDTITSNNLSGVTKDLKDLGYDTPYGQMNVYEAKSALYQLYLLNSDEFWSSLKRIPFNYQKADISTSPALKEKFRTMAQEINGNEVQNKDWWEEVVNSVSNPQTVESGRVSQPISTNKDYTPLIIIGIAALVILIFALKS